MRAHRLLALASVGSVALTLPASGQDEPTAQGMLAIAKFAGACGILDSMINFQKTTRMPGGDDFVVRFWAVEAARLGTSVEGLSDRCNQSIIAYDKLWKAGEPPRK